jgi:hypothetical protein
MTSIRVEFSAVARKGLRRYQRLHRGIKHQGLKRRIENSLLGLPNAWRWKRHGPSRLRQSATFQNTRILSKRVVIASKFANDENFVQPSYRSYSSVENSVSGRRAAFLCSAFPILSTDIYLSPVFAQTQMFHSDSPVIHLTNSAALQSNVRQNRPETLIREATGGRTAWP